MCHKITGGLTTTVKLHSSKLTRSALASLKNQNFGGNLSAKRTKYWWIILGKPNGQIQAIVERNSFIKFKGLELKRRPPLKTCSKYQDRCPFYSLVSGRLNDIVVPWKFA